MAPSLRRLLLSFSLGMFCGVPALTQTSEATPETTSTSPVAYIYVQTSKGVNLYDASAAGKLTLVTGSPFKTEGSMGGSNGKYLISVGTDYIHHMLLHPMARSESKPQRLIPRTILALNVATTRAAGLCSTTPVRIFI